MSDTPIIEAQGLTRTFHLGRKSSVTALDNVRCELREGTCLAVVGESGSGKSTLARVIVGLESADAGTVRIAGTEVKPTTARRQLRERAKLVQMVFQDPQGSLNRSLPVSVTIDEMLRAHRPDLDAAGRRARVLELFAEVGLTERHADAKPAALSGGQKQRVAIARALAAEPKIIVLDEAVSALDVSVQAQVLELLKRLREEHGLSYLFITHDLSVVRDIADDVVVMRHGRIIERGPVSTVLDDPQEPYTKLLIASAPRPGWKPQRGLRDALLGAEG
ncbi:ABC transporter ATP-binding protein [Leucobacter luti]|uniref:Peptide/nickel transport system ATP-binding protein n=1 Tax=Leucobacter luti TaxID=340320 RepID=A0A4Q7U2T2_9MICO|nr:ABC transporter ATP-binding protein [Leucobacter luti]MBL3699050.1 ABC transporter ATP-binding protein [Leucobacter luti]RZT66552.1 peptide/nickel transport system ATP-binding protein [Leucobacter luti]